MIVRKPMPVVVAVCSLAVVLLSCQPQEIHVTRVVTQQETITIVETVVETLVEQETVVEVVTAMPETAAAGESTLVICLRDEPDTLYGFYPDGQSARNAVLAAIYDGPIDTRSFGYQSVILEKIPSLADGDAVIEIVAVEEGDVVVDDASDPVLLGTGTVVRPAGCYSSECAVVFDGAPVEMEQVELTWTLKPGITWSDGVPLTASDSVFGYELQRDPDTPLAKWLPNRTAGYRAIDEHTLVWTGVPGFVGAFESWFFEPRPEHLWGDLTALELSRAELSNRKPLGWGPYVIDEWAEGDHIAFHRNVHYWRANEGLPAFDKLVYRFIGNEPGGGLAALLSGECDVLDESHGLQERASLLLELQAAGRINAHFVTGDGWEHADFGILPSESYGRLDFFGDVRTRRGIAHCMDRLAIADQVFAGQSTVMHSNVMPNHPLYYPDVAQYAHDVQEGSTLLEQVGWVDDDGDPKTPRVAQDVASVRDGTPLEFSFWTTSDWQRQQSSQIIQRSLAECGVKISVDFWEPELFYAVGSQAPIFGRRFDVAQFAWSNDVGCEVYSGEQVPGDPEAVDRDGALRYPLGWYGLNNPGFNNPDYDAACSAVRAAPPGTSAYERGFSDTQRVYSDQLPSIPLYASVSAYATRPDLIGFAPDGTDYWEFSTLEEFTFLEAP